MFSSLRVYVVLVVLSVAAPAGAVPLGIDPGEATANVSGDRFTLATGAIQSTWQLSGNMLYLTRLAGADGQNLVGTTINQTGQFTLDLDGQTVTPGHPGVTRLGGPTVRRIEAEADATRLGDRSAGYEVVVPYRYTADDKTLDLDYIVSIRDGANYVRPRVELRGNQGTVNVNSVGLVDYIIGGGGTLVGEDVGQVVTGGPVFLGAENPMTTYGVSPSQFPAGNRYTSSAASFQSVAPGKTAIHSAVIGVAPNGQFRRGFAYYLNRRRAAPYHQYLHYNGWFDISFVDRTGGEAEWLDRIARFKQELRDERGVSLDGFALDDPWDEPTASPVWNISASLFPNEWQNMKAAAAEAGAGMGAWMSPFGGYYTYRDNRVAVGKQLGYETFVVPGQAEGFRLSGPNYNARFTAVAEGLINEQGVNYFKFDGIGGGLYQSGPADWAAPDYEAEFQLIDRLRTTKPDLFINATVGAWHSPFYVLHADSIWRDGADTGFHGAGSRRNQWITYRDKEIYHNVVQGSPLYPVHSLMVCGLIAAPSAPAGLNTTPDLADFTNDVRALFGSGVNCQELYISPDLMTEAHWDVLAEGIRWAQANEEVLVDAHWIGGDPAVGEVYGTAAWAPGKGTIMLRNPTATAQTFTLDLLEVFELEGFGEAGNEYRLQSPWAEDAGESPLLLEVGETTTITLDPFEVRVFNATSTDPGCALEGDLNGDGFVGGDDLDIVRGFWGQTVPSGDLARGDASGDGFVGGDDLDVVRAHWGEGTPPAPAGVPEPSPATMLAALGQAWFMKRRKLSAGRARDPRRN